LTFSFIFVKLDDILKNIMEEKYLKLTNTAYKVLDFFPEQDPLKNKAKEKVLAIMENLPLVLATDGWASLQKEKVSSQLLLDIDIFLSYLKLAKSQRWIDDINFLILQKEYEAIKKDILTQKPGIRYPVSAESKINSEIASSPRQGGTPGNDGEETREGLTERQKKILEMLDKNEKAQVSDIIKVLPNITKRTIRRDLDGLLEMGKVVRVGQWNRVFYQKNIENTNRTVILS
jgi:Fe2+ or Zn2+ uptake regulation protein